MWKHMGVELKRGTMANWVIQMAALYLRPFWKRTADPEHNSHRCRFSSRRASRPRWNRASGSMILPNVYTSSCIASNGRRVEVEDGQRPFLKTSVVSWSQTQQLQTCSKAQSIRDTECTCKGNSWIHCPKTPTQRLSRLCKVMRSETGCLNWNRHLKKLPEGELMR